MTSNINLNFNINFDKAALAAVKRFFKGTAPNYQKEMLEELKQEMVASGISPDVGAPYLQRVAKTKAHRLTGDFQSYANCKARVRDWTREQKLLKLQGGRLSCSLHPKAQGELTPSVSMYSLLAQMVNQQDYWFTLDQLVQAYQHFSIKKVPLEAADWEGYCEEDPENFTVKLPSLNSATKKWQHKKSDPAFEKMLVAFCELACTTSEVDDIILMRHALLKDDAGGIMNFSCRLQEDLGTGSVKRVTMCYRLQSLHQDLQAQLSGWNQATQRAMIRDFIGQVRRWYLKVIANLGC